MSNRTFLPSMLCVEAPHQTYIRCYGNSEQILVALRHGGHVRLLRPDGGVECDISPTLLQTCIERGWLRRVQRAETSILLKKAISQRPAPQGSKISESTD